MTSPCGCIIFPVSGSAGFPLSPLSVCRLLHLCICVRLRQVVCLSAGLVSPRLTVSLWIPASLCVSLSLPRSLCFSSPFCVCLCLRLSLPPSPQITVRVSLCASVRDSADASGPLRLAPLCVWLTAVPTLASSVCLTACISVSPCLTLCPRRCLSVSLSPSISSTSVCLLL